mmetsp:Transcript_29599/g.38147  ORF Transcript_29599/g.38147 Transcript_29599/m.38147 type:complete len:740 (+) Transcript_29599:62-2281(+)
MSNKPEGGDTISVYCRIKPTKRDAGFLKQDELENSIMRVHIPERGISRADGYVNNSKTQYNFQFNSIIPMEAKQDEVFDTVGRDAVQNVLEGVNSTIFAYGQTGSGKTFTITGGVDSYDQRGLIPRSISMIFQHMNKQKDAEYTCHISYLEIYNESGFDLLDPSHETKHLEQLPKVTIMHDEDGNAVLKNLSMHRANTEEEALNLLFLGDTNRAIAETPMNLASSRSHCLFTIFVEGRRRGSDTIRRAKLHMVDLAGSERAHKTGASGQTLKEATYINSSLFYLEMVIKALREKTTKNRAHIPYRNSMMTSMLRDSLGGNCKTVMVATVSSEAEQVEETISTCKFAQRVALIKNSAIVNEDLDPTLMIARLKGELGSLREEVSFLKGESGEGEVLNESEIAKLRSAIDTYVVDTDPYATLQMGKMTLTKLKDAFAIFKNLVIMARNDSANPQLTPQTVDNTAAVAELAELRTKLAEREQEVAILVNMVKQAKAGQTKPVDQSGQHSGGGSDVGSESSTGNWVKEVTPDLSSGAGGGGGRGGRAEAKPAAPKPAPRPPVIAVVGGVKLSSDASVLQDAEKAFEYFREQWPRAGSIEDNKRVLKEKFDLAKQLYEEVMESRSSIGYLKKTIEAVRRERAMEREGLAENADGSDANEENKLISDMDKEKAKYADVCGRLRNEKAAIEHIQKLMTTARGKLQADFDEWCLFKPSHFQNTLSSETISLLFNFSCSLNNNNNKMN